MSSSAALFRLKLTQLMKDNDWSAHDLAARSGVSNSLIYRWLQGETSPSLDNLDRIAAALGIPSSSLLNDKAAPSPSTEILKNVDPSLIRSLELATPKQLKSIKELLELIGLANVQAAAQEEALLPPNNRKKLRNKG
jgi:transcriptional regulator with XRE-family HTH domain